MNMKPVVTYIRVGNESQLQDKAERMQEILNKYAVKEGYQVTGTYYDLGKSGRTLNRPGIQSLLDDIDEGEVDRVLVPNRSHLSRDPRHSNFPCEVISMEDDARLVSESDQLKAIIRERMAKGYMLKESL